MNRPSDCLINPKKSRGEPVIGPLALLVAVPGDLNLLSQAIRPAGELRFKNPWLRLYHLPAPPRFLALAGPVLGSPQAVMVLEKMIVLGARRVLLFGWTGSLKPDLLPGDLLLPEWAESEEGTSRHYRPEPDPRPHPRFLADLRSALDHSDLPYRTGPVWTTDAPYRETRAKIRVCQSRGIWGVDMETSAVFTVGAFRGIETAALLMVSDELSGESWRHGFRDPRFLNSRKQTVHWLLERFSLLSS
jgi:purine-nucleoside phosphorylase